MSEEAIEPQPSGKYREHKKLARETPMHTQRMAVTTSSCGDGEEASFGCTMG